MNKTTLEGVVKWKGSSKLDLLRLEIFFIWFFVNKYNLCLYLFQTIIDGRIPELLAHKKYEGILRVINWNECKSLQFNHIFVFNSRWTRPILTHILYLSSLPNWFSHIYLQITEKSMDQISNSRCAYFAHQF